MTDEEFAQALRESWPGRNFRAALLVEWNELWHHLADLGACDGFGGAEYHRITEQWIAAQMPLDMADFIRQRANASPDGKHGSQPGGPP